MVSSYQVVLYATSNVSGSFFEAIMKPIIPKKIYEINNTQQDGYLLEHYHMKDGGSR